MKVSKIWLPLIVFGAVAAGIYLGAALNFKVENPAFAKNASRTKLNRLIDFIDNEYVDKVNTDSIVDLTVNNILAKLDPHSVYIPSSEQTQVAESMKGDFVGIGVNFYMYNDTVAVIKPLANGPSEKAGIKAGDRILYADNFKLFGKKISTDTLFSKLKGAEGSEINLKIFRKSENKILNIKLKRGVVPIKSVDLAVMQNATTGYISINRFAETTYAEFKSALSKLKSQGAATMIIDLRDNGGGYLERAVEIVDEFLKKDELIVFTKNRKGRIDKTYATSGGIFETGKLFVLINENSASASEIFAGAIQDNDRGTIVGRRSFGKGLVQREMDFEDGSAVRLTVARYYTPSGRSIQKNYGKGEEDYFNEFDKRFLNGELYEKDSIKIADTLKFKTRAGKIVYGGGGIVPDVFVPIDANHGEESVLYLLKSPAVGHFAFEELDKNRKQFENMKYSEFSEKMRNVDYFFPQFQKYVYNVGLRIDLQKHKKQVDRYLLSEFAKQLFNDEIAGAVLLKEDKMLEAVLKVK